MTQKEIIYRELKASKKYRYLCDTALHRISARAAEQYDTKRAVKAAKNKLHQVYGAFLESSKINKIQKHLAQLPAKPDGEGLKRTALEIMKCHTSTRERIPILDKFYPDLFGKTGKPKRILDAACGLNPFSIPWMDLGPDTEYLGFDIDKRLVSGSNEFLKNLNGPYRVECSDIMCPLPGFASDADMIFLLKILPSLEQQEKGTGEKLLKSLEAKHIVISYPVMSLTGKGKGMEKYYRDSLKQLVDRLSLTYFRLEYPAEIFYVIYKT